MGQGLTTEMEMEKVYHMPIKMALMRASRRKVAFASLRSSLANSLLSWAILSLMMVFLLFRLFRFDRSWCVRPVSSSSSSPSSDSISSSSQSSELDLGALSVSLRMGESIASGMSEGRLLGLVDFLLLADMSLPACCISEELLRLACPAAAPSGSMVFKLAGPYCCSLMADSIQIQETRGKSVVDDAARWRGAAWMKDERRCYNTKYFVMCKCL